MSLPDPILDVMRLAARWHSSASQIRKLNAVEPNRLPPRLEIGGRILLWRLADVEAWEAARVGAPAAPAVSKAAAAKRGRKSVAEKAREAAHGQQEGA